MSKKTESPLDFELHNACRAGDVGKVQRILDSGRVHVDCQHDEDQATPLMVSVMGRRRDCIQVLLIEGADVNADKENGVTALMLASQVGLEDVVRDLIRLGANVDATNQEGGTALMCAAQWGWIHIVEALFEAKCNIHKAMKDGTTALFLSAQAGHDRVLASLLIECMKRNRDVGIFIAAPRQDGSSPLFIACQLGHLECVKILLENGAEVDQGRLDDATPLFKACHKGHLNVVKELLKYRANLGMLQNGETCLHAAALSGNSLLVELLLAEPEVDPNLRNSEGQTALDLAREAGNLSVARILQDHTTPKSESSTSSSPSMSCLKTSSTKPSSSVSTLDKSSTPKQHVRFDLEKADRDRRVPNDLGAIVRVHCRMVSSDDLRRKSQSPVRLVWRNSTLVQSRSQEATAVEINSSDCCSAVRTH